MARRLIAAKTFEDEWFGCLDDRKALVWVGLITTIADDQGRFPAISALIRSRLFAYRDVPIPDVEEALEAFTAAGKLHRYEADGKTLLQIVNWWKHQRPTWAQPSDYPAPRGWSDKARHRENGKYVVSETGRTVRQASTTRRTPRMTLRANLRASLPKKLRPRTRTRTRTRTRQKNHPRPLTQTRRKLSLSRSWSTRARRPCATRRKRPSTPSGRTTLAERTKSAPALPGVA